MNQCKITQSGNELLLSFPYDAAMVADLKSSIPANDRRYDPKNKSWRIAPSKAAKIQNLCHKYFNELPFVPDIAAAKPVVKSQIIDVRYIGITKDRGSDDRSAYGWFSNGWNVIFPEPVLRTWFDAPQNPDEAPTLYSVLAVSRDATDEEIKSGYRRMALQWHPDKCREPNAQEQFMAIQHAYDVLTKRRERYDAGLAFEMSLRTGNSNNKSYSYDCLADGYRSPLRCGLIMCEGIESLGVFNVSKIFAWQDITDSSGRTLIVSWPKGAEKFSEVWA
jgi:hypothetical protein